MSVHPLLNPDSTHYRVNRDEVLQHARDSGLFHESQLHWARNNLPARCEMIQIIETLLSKDQLQGFALGNFIKYARSKDDAVKDAQKAQDYKNYYEWLKE